MGSTDNYVLLLLHGLGAESADVFAKYIVGEKSIWLGGC
jgi:hypothetical protein